MKTKKKKVTLSAKCLHEKDVEKSLDIWTEIYNQKNLLLKWVRTLPEGRSILWICSAVLKV